VTTFDTNVVVRLLVEDDAGQTRQAEMAWRRALADGGVFLPKIVLVETAWVLRRAYKFDNATLLATLKRLVAIDGVVIEDLDEVKKAIVLLENGVADFSDYLIFEAALKANALPVKTFDQRFAREEDVELIGAATP
jgi:predicted nucleic-acid-binding protein